MLFFGISIVAGVLTILAPCILPLLPIVIGSSVDENKRSISKRSVVVITSLSISVIIFTLLLKASTLLIDIPQSFWNWFSGLIIVLVGLAILYPQFWARIPFVNKLNLASNKVMGSGYQKKNYKGDMLIGFALGPVFTTCSPTYLFIIATVLPAGFVIGLLYLLGFTLGLAVSLLLVAYFGQKIINKITTYSKTTGFVKKAFGIVIIVVGIAIITGYDKKLETWILDSEYGATIKFEENLIDKFAPKQDVSINPSVLVSKGLQNVFPKTDWSKVNPVITNILSGGPGKDGIPAIDNPVFESVQNFKHPDSIQAIVLKDGSNVKAYPYNILTWHEIVNDTVGGVPVAVTFCPLCGSAIVFDRRLKDDILSFGVSGFLIESNMIMYDRESENLWQQSTGESLAGTYLNQKLSLISFQLLTIKEIKEKYPQALVLSENTGYQRDYANNPYSGYETNERFIFDPSSKSNLYPQKDIFVVFNLNDKTVGIPWLDIKENKQYQDIISEQEVTVEKINGELFIKDKKGESIPFYFEMWFSFYVQHQDEGIVFNLEN